MYFDTYKIRDSLNTSFLIITI